jgi:hypothetical protein
MYDTAFLPGLDGENTRRAGMAFDNVGLDDGFQIEMLPVLGGFLEHGVEINGVGDYFAGGFGSFSENSRDNNHRLACDFVVDSGHDGIIL